MKVFRVEITPHGPVIFASVRSGTYRAPNEFATSTDALTHIRDYWLKQLSAAEATVQSWRVRVDEAQLSLTRALAVAYQEPV